jgi:hypothetical protein
MAMYSMKAIIVQQPTLAQLEERQTVIGYLSASECRLFEPGRSDSFYFISSVRIISLVY